MELHGFCATVLCIYLRVSNALGIVIHLLSAKLRAVFFKIINLCLNQNCVSYCYQNWQARYGHFPILSLWNIELTPWSRSHGLQRLLESLENIRVSQIQWILEVNSTTFPPKKNSADLLSQIDVGRSIQTMELISSALEMNYTESASFLSKINNWFMTAIVEVTEWRFISPHFSGL